MNTDFYASGLSPSLIAVAQELGYLGLTPVQAQAIPLLLAGRDLLAQSDTGSGKTAAYVLPILEKLSAERALQALVMCPTRELCAQVAREFRKLGRDKNGLVVLVISGGESGTKQAAALSRGVHVVVGTPGRLLDHIARQRIVLDGLKTVVLDEADRMLDMGFLPDIERILAVTPNERQTVLFSATYPAQIESISGRVQRDAALITIAAPAEEQLQIRQLIIHVQAGDRLAALCWQLAEHKPESALIFCNFKATVAEVTGRLAQLGLSVACLHGDLEQAQRDLVMAQFRNRSVRLLVATDVAARGIDVAELEMVVNYEVPGQPDVYTHRIGRTGRAGTVGLAVSLLIPGDERKLPDMSEQSSLPLVRLSAGHEHALKHAEYARAMAEPAKRATIHIAGGRKDKLRPGDILGALTGEAGGLSADDVGKIEIHDRFCFVAVTRARAPGAVVSINQGRLKGRTFRASLVG